MKKLKETLKKDKKKKYQSEKSTLHDFRQRVKGIHLKSKCKIKFHWKGQNFFRHKVLWGRGKAERGKEVETMREKFSFLIPWKEFESISPLTPFHSPISFPFQFLCPFRQFLHIAQGSHAFQLSKLQPLSEMIIIIIIIISSFFNSTLLSDFFFFAMKKN